MQVMEYKAMATYRKRGNSWRAEINIGGTRKSKTFPTKTQAKSWAAEAEYNLSQESGGISHTHTLGDVFDRYAEEVSAKKNGGDWELKRLNAYKRSSLSKIKLVDLRREHLEEWIEIRLKSVKSSSVNRDLNLISHCLTMARRWRLMNHKPLDDLKRPKDPPHRDRLISPSEKEAILLSANFREGDPLIQQQQRVAVAFLFAIETAMRAGEICGLMPQHIDIKNRVAHLPLTKNGASRDVPLSKRAVELLHLLEPWPVSGPVFSMTSSQLSALFRKIVGRTGIENLTFHDTRHEAITRLAKKLDVLDLARMVGHRDIKQLLTYYNRSAKDMAQQLD